MGKLVICGVFFLNPGHDVEKSSTMELRLPPYTSCRSLFSFLFFFLPVNISTCLKKKKTGRGVEGWNFRCAERGIKLHAGRALTSTWTGFNCWSVGPLVAQAGIGAWGHGLIQF